MRRTRARAFTLTELLAALGTVALLIAILIQSLADIRESARRSRCAANIHQFVLACTLYAGDNRDYLPRGRRLNWFSDDYHRINGQTYLCLRDTYGLVPRGAICASYTIAISPDILPDNGSPPDYAIGMIYWGRREGGVYQYPLKITDGADPSLCTSQTLATCHCWYSAPFGVNAPHTNRSFVVRPGGPPGPWPRTAPTPAGLSVGRLDASGTWARWVSLKPHAIGWGQYGFYLPR